MQSGIPFPDISPEIVSISLFGMEFALRWYAMAYIVGIIIGWRITVAALKRPALWRDQTPAMTPEQLENLLTWIVIGIIGGGRLGYVLFYQPGYYLQNPAEIPMIWTGGMSFHGGFLGVVLAILIFARRHGIPLGSAADSIALASPPAILLGRIANFINAELWGRPTDLPWGVIFPGEAAQACATAGQLCARHPSQLYEAFLEGVVLLILLVWLAFRRGALRTPWLMSGVFFTGYGLGRFAVEFVRQPDAQFVSPGNPLGLALHINGWGLTMGQLLTLPMIIIGLAVIVAARRARA
ncbi:prolipoprotein diacylglyceryl transferase [Ponticoccus sp. SC2-23]|uniref:prolipoprotein diacylglyceryl transferase n=1 Tax=Alexandriicola marinus TaxID=2081710 RepID=UPI000FD92C2D|nr:prolipoprotein diacylglyceryl transferase [Alexandriicola marinus]MBM1220048.1 prolipoprotein diacylglyceryl transferase [Ponticoccus sp. SC6-9]MBM1224734.1 prolipoprotein diacylglyceryl transferase [Ponticoccus sp. SC6-15]MBM1228247.1 prolipoprotein diacylglyceryl transferase [Ponticoccus sp. SC6-38]MBM1234115.1 prolipoprotein diacylglyceryl transferase [Ponticoccus sp. SC6-45]MBM1238749.1 prolipoprotein diacylglyceryl transferase [Ponticoccus sp. SC6-49]MBM1242530.1 prolipoprotein diacyl